ncbi:MAG TPA: FtsW/RodA/SpoVE family cell cycle protein [Lachnospiraceae bacterium]|nr:FtsW/RodA/SpoVE family cell cycle protein [Lachnospiraceae bacterium]
MFEFKQYDFRRYNYSLVVLVIIVVIVGAFMIRLVEPSDGNKQFIGLILGLFAMTFVSLIDYHYICRFIWIWYILNIILLALVFVPGLGKVQFDTQRWINLRVFDLQPSELSKIMLSIIFAQFYTDRQEKMDRLSTVFISAIMIIIPILMIMKQPNLSSCLVLLFIYVTMIFAAGLSYKIIVPILAIGLPTMIGVFWYIQQPYQKLIDPYQQNRVLSFLHPEKYPDLMWQQNNSIELIGSGKLYGKLFSGNVLEVKSKNLAVSESDFIFSVIGEQIGFIGGCIIIALLAVIIFKCLAVARNARDYTGMLLATGISAMFMFQVFANIGVVTSILPNTGLPLPFVSYGLSSLVSYMIGIGLVLNVSLQRKNIRG